MKRLLALGLLLHAAGATALRFDYGLKPQPIAEGVYVFEGRREHFERDNGGNIVNTGFIVGEDGVIVIDSGPSKRYGEQMRAAIARVTDRPIVRVYLTHEHPDHFLGNQAFAGLPIAALPGTAQAIREHGEALAENLYRLVGGWMLGTLPLPPTETVQDGEALVAGRRLKLIALDGHTGADLAVYDVQSRTLFAGDLVFFERAPTTPNAELSRWLAALERLQAVPYERLVPGHGPVNYDAAGIAQTRDYLMWLSHSLRQEAQAGRDMAELLQGPLPERFAGMAVLREEYRRSVSHLFPGIETESLPRVSP